MKHRAAVVGGGPPGACAAEILEECDAVEVTLFGRSAIPLCMIGEFNFAEDIVERKIRKIKMISSTNREVNIGQPLADDEYIGNDNRDHRRLHAQHGHR